MLDNNSSGEHKRILMAVFLTALVILLFQFLFPSNDVNENLEKVDEKAERKIALGSKKSYPRREVLLENEEIIGALNLRGNKIDKISLKKYRENLDEETKIKIFHPDLESEEDQGISDVALFDFAKMGWITDQKFNVPDASTLWNVSGDALKSGDSLVLTWRNKRGIEFKREISLDKNYMFKVRQTVVNRSGDPIKIANFGAIKDDGLSKKQRTSVHQGALGYLNDDLVELDYRDLQDEAFKTKAEKGWFGFTSQYFQSAYYVDQPITVSYRASGGGKDDYAYQADFVTDMDIVESGASKEVEFYLFAGAKERFVIEKYEEEIGIYNFELSLDYGTFYFFSKPFSYVLIMLNQWIGNFGVAIIIFTLMIRLLLFPLSNKSFKSMKKMRELSPEIKRIQRVYQNDKLRMNQEIAFLYKKHKVNPASGCLPILLQIPVFFALYKALIISIEMRHAPFFGWIKDLSAADPTSIFNLFGLLPYEPFEWLPTIGILPFIMGLTMWAQQRMTPKMGEQNAQQMKFMKWIPVIFTVMLARLPSGLVLYWTMSNLFSIIQQKIIQKRES
jgi:YidC/Oxa1 family membrane protein insertase